MATIPSIAMIPSGYKASKVYSVLPTDGAGDLTFSRAGALPSYNATRVNENGLIEEVLSNVPRLDYSDGGCPSLLLEPQRTNLVTYSEDFSNAAWMGGGAGAFTVTTNQAISPKGDLTADKLIASANYCQIRQDKAVINTQMSLSVWMRTNSGTKSMKLFINDVQIAKDVTVTTEWQNFSVSGLVGGTLLGGGRVGFSNNNILDESGHIYIWGAQLEEGSYPTSYIPTVGSTVTRVAESCDGAGNEQVINSTEGVLYVEASKINKSEVEGTIAISRDVNNEIRMNFATNNRLNVYVNVDGSNQVYMDNTNYNLQEYNKIAIKYKLNDYSVFVNGNKIHTDTNATVPSGLNLVDFNLGTSSNKFYGKVKNLQVFNTALSDLELETITSYTSFEEMALALGYTTEITL